MITLISFLSYWTLFPEDLIRYGFCLFGLFPLCYIYQKYIQTKANSTLKHLFSICFGLFVCVYCFGITSPFHSIFTSLVVYCLMKWFPKQSGYASFVFCMLYVSLLHIYRMWNYWMIWSMDIAGVQMLLTIKLTSYAFEYSDRYSDQLQQMNCCELPNIIEWYGYVYFFPSFLVGPTISFDNYRTFINSNREISSDTFKLGIYKLIPAMLLLMILYCKRYFPIEYMMSDEFSQCSFYTKIWYLILSQFIIRCKYYFAWTFSYACYLVCGVNEIVNGKQTVSIPEVGLNVNILEIETAQNIYQITNNWNICTNEWLKDHIYKRSIILGFKKQHSTYITNIVSALWHGFYPGYIITFVTGGMLTELGRLIRSQIRPYFLSKNESKFDILKKMYDMICLFMVITLMAYTTVPFQVFGFWETYAIWYNLYFVGHIFMGIAVVLLFIETKWSLNKNKII